jgi:hypothetical protein
MLLKPAVERSGTSPFAGFAVFQKKSKVRRSMSSKSAGSATGAGPAGSA